ncbi:unnamed protein product [Amaranthus hypochondriacus]
MAFKIIISPIFLVVLLLLLFVLSGLYNTSYATQQAIKTIKIKSGVYDCIDFYKQPAFNHPLLKNLTNKVVPKLGELQRQNDSGIGFDVDDRCPIGTVPILREYLNSTHFLNSSSLPSNDYINCAAVVHTVDDLASTKFCGSGGLIVLYKPYVQATQWSSARFKLINGNDFIEAGWMVNPDVFKNFEAHLYVKFSAGTSGCINVGCPGFVQVSTAIPVGAIPSRYTKFGAPIQYGWHLYIDKDQIDGNWWLSIASTKYKIGYWPKEIFTTLGENANQIEWGGEIGSGPKTSQYPEMGFGAKANYNTGHTLSIQAIDIVNEYFISVQPQNTKKVVTCENLYTIRDAGNPGGSFGRIVLFGGPWDK